MYIHIPSLPDMKKIYPPNERAGHFGTGLAPRQGPPRPMWPGQGSSGSFWDPWRLGFPAVFAKKIAGRIVLQIS